MATHSSVLAWRIPGMEEPGGLPSMGSHRVRPDCSDLAAAAAAAGVYVCVCVHNHCLLCDNIYNRFYYIVYYIYIYTCLLGLP